MTWFQSGGQWCLYSKITREEKNAGDNCPNVQNLENKAILIASGLLCLAYCHSIGCYSLNDVMSASWNRLLFQTLGICLRLSLCDKQTVLCFKWFCWTQHVAGAVLFTVWPLLGKLEECLLFPHHLLCLVNSMPALCCMWVLPFYTISPTIFFSLLDYSASLSFYWSSPKRLLNWKT